MECVLTSAALPECHHEGHLTDMETIVPLAWVIPSHISHDKEQKLPESLPQINVLALQQGAYQRWQLVAML